MKSIAILLCSWAHWPAHRRRVRSDIWWQSGSLSPLHGLHTKPQASRSLVDWPVHWPLFQQRLNSENHHRYSTCRAKFGPSMKNPLCTYQLVPSQAVWSDRQTPPIHSHEVSPSTATENLIPCCITNTQRPTWNAMWSQYPISSHKKSQRRLWPIINQQSLRDLYHTDFQWLDHHLAKLRRDVQISLLGHCKQKDSWWKLQTGSVCRMSLLPPVFTTLGIPTNEEVSVRVVKRPARQVLSL